jgi:hypothetical protein
MAWFKVDDHFAFHPKVIAAGNGAIGLWVRAGAWSAAQMTDGFVPSAMIPALGASEADAEALASQGLWTPCEAGWNFHDWEQCQPTRAQVIDRREKRAAAGRIGGVRSGQSRKAAGHTPNAPRGHEASAEASASAEVKPRTNPRTRPVPKSSAPTDRGDADASPDAVNAGHVVAAWTEACEANGVAPSTAQRAQVGKQARELLAKNDPAKVIEAAAVAGAKGYASIDRELTALNGRPSTARNVSPIRSQGFLADPDADFGMPGAPTLGEAS